MQPAPDHRPQSTAERVPVRTIAVAIGMVLVTLAILFLAHEVARVLTWLVVAAFFAVVLGPVVDLVERRLRLRRILATLLVFLVGLALLAGLLTVFIRPLASEVGSFVDEAPAYVEQARQGRGPIGELILRYNLNEYVERNQARLREGLNQLSTPALALLRSVFSTVVALVTIFVLTFLMVLQGPSLLRSWVNALPQRRQERVRRVAADCAKAVTGYMTGNLVISVVAGSLTYVVLWVLGVPFKGVVALFVAIADLIPLVGATLGAVVATGVALLSSPLDGLIVLVFFVLYQQFENHVLQPVVMSRTVELSALAVTVAILIGVELFGILGALLAIPAAGVIHVVGRDLYDQYRGRIKAEPTVGADQLPVSQPPPEPGQEARDPVVTDARD